MSPTSKTKAASPGKAATASAKATTEKTGTASTKKAGAAASGQDGPAGGAYAIVEASGQQFWLQPNRYYDLDRLAVDVDGTLTIDNVLLVNDGKATTLGQPYVKGASVALKVMAHRRGPKLIVYKMRPKKKTRRKNGHRQELTRVMVESISIGGKALA